MRKIATPQDLRTALLAIQTDCQGPDRPSRRVLASKLRGLADRVAGLMPPGLKRIIDKAERMLEDRVHQITFNVGYKAHADLDKLESVRGRVLSGLEDADADYGSRFTEEAKDLLQEMQDQIEETQRELDDRGFLEDEYSEDACQEYVEDRIYEMEKVIEEFGRLR